MAAPNAPTASLLSLLCRSFPSTVSSNATESDIPDLTTKLYPQVAYTSAEKAEISQWLTASSHLILSAEEDAAKQAELLGTLNMHLSTRTTLLGGKPSIADIALYARLAPIVETWSSEKRTGEQGYHHIVRHIDFVQNGPAFGLHIPEEEKVKINLDDVRFIRKPVDGKAEKERKKKEKEAVMGGAAPDEAKSVAVDSHSKPSPDQPSKSKKEKAKEKAQGVKDSLKDAAPVAATAAPDSVPRPKKEKAPKQPKPQAVPKEVSLTPSLIDLRVGHILKAIPHPNADSLYVSTIACGDAPGTDNTSEYDSNGQTVTIRTVCSGLNGLIPLGEMQNRRVVVVCNLKPVTMRGIKSAAMVLAASPRPVEGEEADGHGGPVELVDPPEGAETGARVFFEGWEGEPEKVLNPKKKIWETVQPGFTTTGSLEVAFDSGVVPQLNSGEESASGEKTSGMGRLVTEGGGVCKVKSLKGATVR